MDNKNPLAILFHLYKYPLYSCCPQSEDNLNVLIVGFDNNGESFLDSCLQCGQIIGKNLSVRVVSEKETDKPEYIAERPGLPKFFDIDDSLSDEDDSYGRISFSVCQIDKTNKNTVIHTLQTIMCEQYDVGRPHYVFISLGDDNLNLAAAEACREAAEVFEIDCAVSYVCEDESFSNEKVTRRYPLLINAEIESDPLYPEIERMAFNTHLVWEKSLNVDQRSIKAEFRKAYNYNSCISNVLSLKYKLHSIGIDIDTSGSAEAAKLFTDVLSDKSNKGLKNKLIWIEHRRWVAEKLCAGWQQLTDLNDCATGITKDEKRKRHVCIVRSRPDQKLAIDFRKSNYTKWDKSTKDELNELDDLDRMSVELHRMYARKAKQAKKLNLLSGDSIAAIRSQISESKKAFVAFQEWFTCLKEIWFGDKDKVSQYKGLKKAFLASLDDLSASQRTAVREHVKAFEAIYYPVLACTEYRDYKQDDVALVDNTPFILTYTEKTYLAVPFATGNNTAIFENVAAATVVNPSRILYVYYIDNRHDLSELINSIPFVIEYLQKKKLKAAVEFILLHSLPIDAVELKDRITQLGKRTIRQIKFISVSSEDTAIGELTEYLDIRRKNKKMFAVEMNNSKLAYMLRASNFYSVFPYYRFDSQNAVFTDTVACENLRYIRKTPFITVADMVAFRRSSSESSNHPEFYSNYEELFEKYLANSSAWKSLCEKLNLYDKEREAIAAFGFKDPDKRDRSATGYNYILPFKCRDSIRKILEFLTEQKILDEGSYVTSNSTDSCKVMILDQCRFRDEYDKLFSNVYALMIPDAIDMFVDTKSKQAKIVFNSLVVKEADIGGSDSSAINELMDYFERIGYVLNLKRNSGYASFTYATRSIKELLTTAGKILEVYTYHKAKALGKFDDVVSSYEIDWQDTSVKNELDLIVTHKFCSLFVECKARLNIEQDFYFKLLELKDRFGINATAVLVADTQEEQNKLIAPVNSMQRSRGDMMDVVTIWKPEEIKDIGNVLFRIINGTYKNNEEA